MSERKHRGGAIAVAGIVALLTWLLLGRRGGGWRRAGRREGGGIQIGGGPPCRVHLDENGVELDGVRADLSIVVSRCRAAGIADVTATGATIVRTIAEVLVALRDAGVVVRASPDLLDVVGLATAGAGQP
jgi:hypothetical protein